MTAPADFLAALAAIVGEAHVLHDAQTLAPYCTDWRGRYRGAALAAVLPASTQEVAAIVRASAAHRIPIVPQGGNTSLCGASVPAEEAPRAIVLNTARMNRILAVDAENNTLTAQAGCTLAAAQQAAQNAGRLFALSLASEGSCQLGGNLSTNAGGIQVLRYGNTRELTLGLEVVLADGQIWDGLRALRKDNTGYDLKQLFIGAEGTLGIITAAVLKLHPLPTARAAGWLALESPSAALALLHFLRDHFAERISAFELIGQSALELVARHIPRARPPFAPAAHPWSIYLELADAGQSEELAQRLTAACADALARGLIRDAALPDTLAGMDALRALRENISEAQKREGISIKHDISLPIRRIPAFLDEAQHMLCARWPQLRIVCFGHLGDGNLHYNLSLADATANAALLAQEAAIHQAVHDLVHAHHGSISAEHGLGQLKRHAIARYKSPLELALMRTLKQTLDPHNLMNPGKVLPDA